MLCRNHQGIIKYHCCKIAQARSKQGRTNNQARMTVYILFVCYLLGITISLLGTWYCLDNPGHVVTFYCPKIFLCLIIISAVSSYIAPAAKLSFPGNYPNIRHSFGFPWCLDKVVMVAWPERLVCYGRLIWCALKMLSWSVFWQLVEILNE